MYYSNRKSFRGFEITSTAYVLIHCQNSHENYIIEQLKKIDAVKEIQEVFGIYDIVIKIKANDTKMTTDIISTQIKTIDKLKSALTLMVSNPEGDYL